MAEQQVAFGPCCFCAKGIEEVDVDPCRINVETNQGKWQVWFCHAACFKERLGRLPDYPDFFDPFHF